MGGSTVMKKYKIMKATHHDLELILNHDSLEEQSCYVPKHGVLTGGD
jgi:hypothetical protein